MELHEWETLFVKGVTLNLDGAQTSSGELSKHSPWGGKKSTTQPLQRYNTRQGLWKSKNLKGGQSFAYHGNLGLLGGGMKGGSL